MDRDYCFEVTVTWTQVCSGKNKKEAIENLKDTFEEEFGFRPTDKEIKAIKYSQFLHC